VREKLNARYLSPADIPEEIHLVVADVSFISLTLILPPALTLLKSGAHIVPLIKPQFELRREEVGRGGIVRDPAMHEAAVNRIQTFCQTLPVTWLGHIESPILGGEGNKEFLAALRVN
jgi:23S rRNA (cytidine1920-2'-O)/16S rRNA (cytidine1409-2'-O)-methyltransferase